MDEAEKELFKTSVNTFMEEQAERFNIDFDTVLSLLVEYEMEIVLKKYRKG